MWLTYGQTVHVDGMTDRHVLSVTYGQMILVDGIQTCIVSDIQTDDTC